MRRERSGEKAGELVSPQAEVTAVPVSSLIPRQTWLLSLLVGCGLLTWATVVWLGVWLDFQQIDPWRDIFGLQSGRLLRFFNTVALLTCSQLSFLILWRRSRSRKDFSGQYRVWFWVGAVCSIYCVATVTRFHEAWASQLAGRMNLVWAESETVCWMVPATTMLLSAMHFMRRDMPFRSASRKWVRVSRILAALSGISLLIGSLVWPALWVGPINAALGALWPAVFASSLLIHARFVTYVTNEASRESLQVRQPSRWETRLKTFAQHVALMASEEWQIQRAQRAAAKAAKASKNASNGTVSVPIPESSSAKPTSLIRRRPAVSDQSVEPVKQEPPATKAVNFRPISRSVEDVEQVTQTLTQSIHVHPAQPIPAPHFEIGEGVVSEHEAQGDEESVESESASPSSSIPAGYTLEEWKSLSKKERKRLQRVESMR